MRKVALLIGQALIVLMLLDGFVDLSYPLARTVALSLLSAAKEPDVVRANRPAGWAGYKFEEVPGLGKVVMPVSAPGLNVDAFGRRSTGNSARSGPRGVLLGSSPAFGFHVADDETVAAALERQRPDLTVANLAGPARTTAESMTNWARVAADIASPDFGILLFGHLESFMACWPGYAGAPPEASEREHQPALISVPSRLLRRLAPPSDTPCDGPAVRAALVERAIYEIRSALAYGQKRTPNFAVVIVPTIFGTDADVTPLRVQAPAQVADALDQLIRELRARLAAEPIPGVIDLSDAFDSDGSRYILDQGNHFTPAGAELLAGEILKRLPQDFFAATGG